MTDSKHITIDGLRICPRCGFSPNGENYIASKREMAFRVLNEFVDKLVRIELDLTYNETKAALQVDPNIQKNLMAMCNGLKENKKDVEGAIRNSLKYIENLDKSEDKKGAKN